VTSNSLTVKELNKAFASIIKAGYFSSDLVINPDVFQKIFNKEVVLKDGKKIIMTMEEYHSYVDTFNPPDWDTYEEYKEKRMVLEL
jgi:hypothetical protein